MFLIVICCILKFSKTHFLHDEKNIHHLVQNKEELINFIKSLGHGGVKDDKAVNDSDNTDDEEKEKKLQAILWLIQKNIKAQKKYENLQKNPTNSGARVYFVENPAVLGEYRRHLNNMRLFINRKKQNFLRKNLSLKSRISNIRRDAMFRVESTGSDRADVVLNEMLKFKPKSKQVRSMNSDGQQGENQILNIDMVDDNAEQERTTRRHKKITHETIRSDNDFGPDRYNRDSKPKDNNNMDRKRKKYVDEPINNDLWETKIVNWDKSTTKDYSLEYKNKKSYKDTPHKSYKEFEQKRKPSYSNPKKDYVKKAAVHLYGRTSIPFIGKGVFDEK